jgi:hypothetical protein
MPPVTRRDTFKIAEDHLNVLYQSAAMLDNFKSVSLTAHVIVGTRR